MSTSRTHHTEAPATPSDADMLAAWQQLRARDWPTLEEIKRSAALYALVRGAALRRSGRVATVQTPAAPAPAPSQPRPAPALRALHAHHPPQFDHKRAAAGEREDD